MLNLPDAKELADELPPIVRIKGPQLCLQCRFSRLLCGRPKCPILMKLSSFAQLKSSLSNQMQSDSPPSAFVGRIGYPRVSFGPLLPPERGNTSIFDEPELWRNFQFEQIVSLRMSMVRAKKSAEIHSASDPSGMLYDTQISMLSLKPVYAEFRFRKSPAEGIYYLDDTSAPFGPSASVDEYRFENNTADRRLEKVYYDKDLKSEQAVLELYRSGLTVNTIQKVFSLGMTGIAKRRKLVPTRWSITAVDDIVSSSLLDEVKMMPSVDLYHVFLYDMLGSRYVIIICPGNFSYEWVEAWFPRTLWNPSGMQASCIADHEGFYGRKAYALPGGCYYSVRLAIAEYMSKLRRQGVAIALREIYPGQLLPLGVWNVREAVRAALETQPFIFDQLNNALDFALSKLKLTKEFWLANSYLIRQLLFQKRIETYADR
ncbi:MAG: Nre family DNA repair protein [Conexivisphaerales archaeon]